MKYLHDLLSDLLTPSNEQGCKELSSKELSSRSSPDILELELN